MIDRSCRGGALLSLLPPLLLFCIFPAVSPSFDVRQHLSTVTRYHSAKDISNGPVSESSIPDGCEVIHLNLVARHGTRAPTKKRIKELDRLAVRLEALSNLAKSNSQEDKPALDRVPGWMRTWQSPWKGRDRGGELVKEGESELYHLGERIRERYPKLFSEDYHPDIYNIKATQVPRASASAVAFGMGLFSGKGDLGPRHHRAFSVISESRASDLFLRFFDTCETYKEYRMSQEPAVEKLKEPIYSEISAALASQYGLNVTVQDVSSLWFLCKQEASLLGITDQACALFNPSEVELLEWADDLEIFILKGYGKSVNYRMGIPLLQDMFQLMEQLIAVKESELVGTYEKARLRFAHAETLVPFTCLLGLFLEQSSDFEKIHREEPLDLPLKPPQYRKWRGSLVAPFAGNSMLVLYACPSNKSVSSSYKSSYFVQALHNEVPIKMPGCGDKDLCPFEDFKEKVVTPHLKHKFENVCAKRVVIPASYSIFSRFSKFVARWSFWSKGSDVPEADCHNGEL